MQAGQERWAARTQPIRRAGLCCSLLSCDRLRHPTAAATRAVHMAGEGAATSPTQAPEHVKQEVRSLERTALALSILLHCAQVPCLPRCAGAACSQSVGMVESHGLPQIPCSPNGGPVRATLPHAVS